MSEQLELGGRQNVPQTMAEKILARASGRAFVRAGDYVTVRPDRLVLSQGVSACVALFDELGIETVSEPSRVLLGLGGDSPAHTSQEATQQRRAIRWAERMGVVRLRESGIAHHVAMDEGYVGPGQLVLGLGQDSTVYGALGAAGASLGALEMAHLLVTGDTWLEVPKTLRVSLNGVPGAALTAKDIALHLLGAYGAEWAEYGALQFHGAVVSTMSLSSRVTLATMGAALGAKFVLFEGAEPLSGLAGGASEKGAAPQGPVTADRGAAYFRECVVDLSQLEPQVARPHRTGNVAPVSAALGTRLDQLFIGSCCNSRLEDLKVAAAIFKGRRVFAGCRMMVTPATQGVHLAAAKAGYLEDLLAAGVYVTAPGSGVGAGAHGGFVGGGHACLSASNHNERGAMGSTDARVFLASPATVAASALAGSIADPREYVRGPLV